MVFNVDTEVSGFDTWHVKGKLNYVFIFLDVYWATAMGDICGAMTSKRTVHCTSGTTAAPMVLKAVMMSGVGMDEVGAFRLWIANEEHGHFDVGGYCVCASKM